MLRQEGPIRGVLKFFKLQMAHGDTKELKLSGYAKPVLFRPKSTDIHLIKNILYEREYNVDLRGLNPQNILDVGANVGYTSVFFANAYPESRVFAFEPEMSNFELLKRNTSGYNHVLCSNLAIWNKKENLKTTSNDYDSWSFSLTESGEVQNGHTFQAISMNEVLQQVGGEIDILKLDVEGAEKEIFTPESAAWLKRVKIIIVELHDRKKRGCSEALYRSLIINDIPFTQKNSGYNTIIYNEIFFEA